MNLKQIIYSILRPIYHFYLRLRQDQQLLKVFLYDALRYCRHHHRRRSKGLGAVHLQALITMESHSIEKGLCFPEPKMGFGVAPIRGVIRCMEKYQRSGFDCSHFAFQNAQSILSEYLMFHERNKYELGALRQEIEPWADASINIGGYREVLRKDIQEQARGDFESCAMSRHSIRTFSEERVPEELIREAVRIAQKSPSVCNRQSWHVYIIKDPEVKQQALALQNGNRGFGHLADFVAIITSDIQTFTSAPERNQTYTDGGLFAMSFMYALHSKNVGACFLNWMVKPRTDRKLRDVVPIKPSENVVLMLVGGFLPERVLVPRSARQEMSQIATFI